MIIASIEKQITEINRQLKLLDYLAKLEKNKPNEAIQSIFMNDIQNQRKGYSKLYWPFLGEYWIDEIDKYHVYLENLCGEEL